jgi:uncharacterized membrane protein YdjX (TVP38/TMEM64 family)
LQNKINLETRIGIKGILLTSAILILLLIPFVLFGDPLDNWTNSFFQSEPSNLIASLVIGSLLSIDVIAPVPSSILSTAGGYFLGFIGGTIISLVGMTISCLIGYWIGAKFGRAAALRLVDTKEISGFESLQKKYGDWIIIISRSVPLLAETSVLFAGIGRMKFNRFISMVTISNLGISMVYAAVGAYSAHINSFLFAFAAAMIFPGVMIVILKNKKAFNPD